MAVMKIRNDADDAWIIIGGGVSVVQQAGEPGTTYPGMLWVDTDADNPGNSIIEDDDNDTKIQCEESADEDIIRMDCAGSEVWNMSAAGERTMVLQPAFHFYPAGDQSNFAINEEVTIVLDTEIFDQGSDFAANAFTAPVDGRYHLNLVFRANIWDSAALYYYITIVTSNKQYYNIYDINLLASADLDFHVLTLSVLADMDAADTAYAAVYQSGGAAQTDIKTGTNFSGFLAC